MLYQLRKDGSDLKEIPLSSLKDAGWNEKDLENILAKRIELTLQEDLMVIYKEKGGKEEPDILALDEDGKLYIFELKRWPADQGSLLQVIRYGQIFGQYSYDDLNTLFKNHVGSEDADLSDKHESYFELSQPLAKNTYNSRQEFVVVAAGASTRTIQALQYWKETGLPIHIRTYHVYKYDGAFFLEFHAFSPKQEDYASLVSSYYVVNTNRTWNANSYLDMLNEEKAASYGDRKRAVDKINKGDKVFLYHNGIGIIASGQAKGKVQVAGEEHYVPLELVLKADPYDEPEKCVPAWEINREMKASYRFRPTCFSINEKMAQTIQDLLEQKRRKE